MGCKVSTTSNENLSSTRRASTPSNDCLPSYSGGSTGNGYKTLKRILNSCFCKYSIC